MVKIKDIDVVETNQVDERLVDSITKGLPTFMGKEEDGYHRLIVENSLVVNSGKIVLLSCYKLSEEAYTKEEVMKIFNDFIKSQELKDGKED